MNLKTYLKTTTQQELADAINKDRRNKRSVTQGAISQWLAGQIPAERVIQLERVSGGLMTRYELRPDIYPD